MGGTVCTQSLSVHQQNRNLSSSLTPKHELFPVWHLSPSLLTHLARREGNPTRPQTGTAVREAGAPVGLLCPPVSPLRPDLTCPLAVLSTVLGQLPQAFLSEGRAPVSSSCQQRRLGALHKLTQHAHSPSVTQTGTHTHTYAFRHTETVHSHPHIYLPLHTCIPHTYTFLQTHSLLTLLLTHSHCHLHTHTRKHTFTYISLTNVLTQSQPLH